MTKRICQLVLFATVLSPAVCQALSDQNGAYINLGIGNSSCIEWTKGRAQGTFPLVGNTSWVLGFLTAVNMYRPGPMNITEGMDVDRLMAWIDKYCGEHPFNSLAEATDALADELLRRSRAVP
jgi:hypothetical protein